MILLLIFAFAGGIATILSPCILPVLPVVLSASVASGKRRPWGIIIGFVVGFTFFTLFLTAVVNAFGISPDKLRDVSVLVIFFFGLSLLIPPLQALVERRISSLFSRVPQVTGNGLRGGILVGLSLGLVWTPCVGPILASVISLALTGKVTGAAFFITLSYSLGTAMPMLAIMYGGRSLIVKVPGLVKNTGKIQKVFGALMILTALAIYFNYDRIFQTYVLDIFPNYGAGLTSLENNGAVKDLLGNLSGGKNGTSNINDASGITAPELIAGGQWFNSPPLTLASLRNKQVVLLDFMTYSCINCIRTFPYVKDWHTKYKDKGLTIIGIHTPEFEFEKNPDNVRKALADFGIGYPVMQDNDYATWTAYGNSFWPREYLIDINGRIVYDHAGEGNYDETERQIQAALKERARVLGEQINVGSSFTQPAPGGDLQFGDIGSPETYFGSARNDLLGNGTAGLAGRQIFAAPEQIQRNKLYLVGTWDIADEFAQNAEKGARVIFRYKAKNVFFVAGASTSVSARILIDGKPIGSIKGKDVAADDTVTISDERLYQLVGDTNATEHTLEVIIDNPGLQAFTFTFG